MLFVSAQEAPVAESPDRSKTSLVLTSRQSLGILNLHMLYMFIFWIERPAPTRRESNHEHPPNQ